MKAKKTLIGTEWLIITHFPLYKKTALAKIFIPCLEIVSFPSPNLVSSQRNCSPRISSWTKGVGETQGPFNVYFLAGLLYI